MKTEGIDRTDKSVRNRIRVVGVLFALLFFIPVFVKLYDIQITRHTEYEEKAVRQQTGTTVLSPARGTIYDRNMNVLAMSAGVYNVIADPSRVPAAERAQLSARLADLLDADADVIAEKLERYKGNRYLMIKPKLEKEESDKVRQYIVDNDLSDKITLEPDNQRYYPYGNFASNILGFTQTDGVGAEGLELKYNAELAGTPGKIVKSNEKSSGVQYERYYGASEGLNLVLTLDETIQHFLEKNLANAVTENLVAKRAFGIVMDVKTGGILAMATSPSYDPNNRSDIADPAVAESLAGLSGEELAKARNEALLAQYRNKAVNDTYEPGSTFKIITASIAIEEKVVTMADRFNCSGSMTVKGWDKPINCWRHIGHGSQDFMQGIQNSCNPVFITVGLRIGRQVFWDYMHAFGFFEKTNVDLPGESSSVITSWNVFDQNDVTLAVYSFGQRFNVTPIQQITAASAVANDGKLMWPHIADKFTDANGNTVKTVEPRVVRSVISPETAAQVRTALESVVSIGTGKNATVKGYAIAGKTGTSQKIGKPGEDMNGRYVVSFLGFAPADDPEIALLVGMDEPLKGDNFNLRSGGQMAAPLAGRVFADILPYLGVNKQLGAGDERAEILCPALSGLEVAAAEKQLKSLGLEYEIRGSGAFVNDQLPIAGVSIPGSAKVVIYTEGFRPSEPVRVPNVIGKSPEQANKALVNAGLFMRVSGVASGGTTVIAAYQDTEPDTEVEPGTVINVEFRDTSAID